MIAGALLLGYGNITEEEAAGEYGERVMEQLRADLKDKTRPDDVPEETQEEPEIPDHILNPQMEMPTILMEGRAYIGTIAIPALELELPVISQWSYKDLKKAPCRYAGSVYTDDMIIAAHRYRAHFRRLDQLRPGDEVIFTDVDGNVFRYEAIETEMLKPRQVEEMLAGEWDLTLFTCKRGASYRVTVRCRRMEEELNFLP